ncbi:MAG: hypothetical protein HYY24_16720 [Verrucomicrobia bacterium]|nr:hypothetical protein [Verrucomicrobiota bacterium]
MPWRELILRNLPWKLLSLFLATVFYVGIRTSIEADFNPFHASGTAQQTRVLPRLPIGLLTSTGDARGFKIAPTEVEVTVRGQAAAVQALRQTDLDAFVDLVDVQDAIGLKKRIRVHVPSGITVEEVKPQVAQVDRIRPSELSPARPDH